MKLGIIGCGLIGKKRADTAIMEGDDLAFVCDTDAKRVNALAAKTGAKQISDWREAVTQQVDMIIIATTHQSLAEISTRAVEAGKHVLVEKPAGCSLEDVTALQEAGDKHARYVKVGFNHRFHPALQKAHQLVAEGFLGPLMFVRGRYGHGGRKGYENEWRCSRDQSGGGELIDQGSHLIDLSRWFMGDLVLDYGKAVTAYWDINVEDNCFLSLRGSGGEVAWLHASWSEWKNLFSFEIYGRNGKLTIDGLGGSYGVESLTYHKMLPEMGPPETTKWEYPFPDRSWHLEYQDFKRAIAENRNPVGNINDAVAMHKIIFQVYAGQSM